MIHAPTVTIRFQDVPFDQYYQRVEENRKLKTDNSKLVHLLECLGVNYKKLIDLELEYKL